MSLQRNEPCHCGSGKKYKKCCLNNDIEKERTKSNNNTLAPLDIPDDISSLEETMNEANNNPDLTDEQNEWLSEWWDVVDKLSDYKDITEHIRHIFDTRPELVEHSELESSIIFELVAPYLQNGKYDEFIELLLELKSRFPEAYKKSYEYYNYYLMVWLLSQDKTEDAKHLLNEYRDADSEKFTEVVELLQATDNFDVVTPFLKDNYKDIFDSGAYWDESFIVDPILNSIISDNFCPDFSESDIKNTIKEIKQLDIEYYEENYDPKYWDGVFTQMSAPLKLWDNKIPKTETERGELVKKISTNFIGFLIAHKKLTNNFAIFLSDKWLVFMLEYLKQNSKSMESLFRFTPNKIEKTVIRLIKDMIWINYTQLYSILLSLFYFLDYIEACGNMQSSDKESLQHEISRMFEKVSKKNHEESLVFKSIPQ